MSKSFKLNKAQRRAAKRVGVPAQKWAVLNELDPLARIPVYSPALALLLCSVHGQKITNAVISPTGDFGVGFVSNKTVEDALENWRLIEDSFETDQMPYHELIYRYLRLVSGRDNCEAIRVLEENYGSRR